MDHIIWKPFDGLIFLGFEPGQTVWKLHVHGNLGQGQDRCQRRLLRSHQENRRFTTID